MVNIDHFVAAHFPSFHAALHMSRQRNRVANLRFKRSVDLSDAETRYAFSAHFVGSRTIDLTYSRTNFQSNSVLALSNRKKVNFGAKSFELYGLFQTGHRGHRYFATDNQRRRSTARRCDVRFREHLGNIVIEKQIELLFVHLAVRYHLIEIDAYITQRCPRNFNDLNLHMNGSRCSCRDAQRFDFALQAVHLGKFLPQQCVVVDRFIARGLAARRRAILFAACGNRLAIRQGDRRFRCFRSVLQWSGVLCRRGANRGNHRAKCQCTNHIANPFANERDYVPREKRSRIIRNCFDGINTKRAASGASNRQESRETTLLFCRPHYCQVSSVPSCSSSARRTQPASGSSTK